MPKVTPEQAARAKLRNFGVPLPQDFIPDLGPACGALFLRECSEATLASVNVNLAAEQGTEGEDDGSAAELLNALTTCLASATIACVRLGLLPKEAEEAMEQAMTVEPVP